jgi:CspA family cold shock protein
LNARQKRLFEDSLKKNPNLKMPAADAPRGELTDEDLSYLKQGVGDKSGRPQTSSSASGSSDSPDDSPAEQIGAVMTYFEEKGFGFLRPDGGGKDIFFHISRLHQGQATDLVPGTRVSYELGMDRNGKIAASSVRILPPTEEVKTEAKPPA